MKAKPMRQTKTGQIECEPSEATHVWLSMPGPLQRRVLPVVHGNKTRSGTNCWSWNDDTEKPTLKPSILTKCGEHVCHSFVNNGIVKFLSDSTHEFAGKTLELLDVDI